MGARRTKVPSVDEMVNGWLCAPAAASILAAGREARAAQEKEQKRRRLKFLSVEGVELPGSTGRVVMSHCPPCARGIPGI